MGGLVDTNRNESGIAPFLLQHPMAPQTGSDVPCRQDQTIAYVPLSRSARTNTHPAEAHFQQSLIVTVQFQPPMVRQHWLLDPPSSLRAYRRLPSRHSPRTYGAVEFQLSKETLDAFTDSQGVARVSPDEVAAPFACAVFARLTHLILHHLETPEMFSPTFMDHFVSLFCARVAGLRAERKEVYRGGLSTWQKRRAIEMLTREKEANVTLPLLARECGLSVSHFARSFKTSFGLPVHRWVIQQRVEKAKLLMLGSEVSLLEIAFQCGFCDQASFNRTFAKLTGLSPGRWRRDFKQ